MNPAWGGRYRALSRLKAGMGVETWHCQDDRSGSEVVVKWASTMTPSAWLRVEHEGRLLRQVESRYVRPVVDWGRDDEGCWCVSPFLAGENLRQRLRRLPPSLEETLAWATALLEGLRAVHRTGLIHRDLKPENIIVNDQGPVLIDFGLARTPGAGSLAYLAPEQSGLLAYDVGEHSDLYALGMLLRECLGDTGPGGEDGLRAHLLARPSLSHVPRAVDDLVARLSQPDPRRRYRKADHAMADLERVRAALALESDPLVVLGQSDRREHLAEPGFVDREKERAYLLDQLDRLVEGHEGPSVWLVASSGGGKSRLLDELALEASRRGVRVLRGSADPERTPFAALEQPIVETSEDLGWREHIMAAIGPWREVLRQVYPVLAGRPATGSGLQGFGTGGAEAAGPEAFGEERVRLALSVWLQSLGRPGQPVVLLVDDAQWADPPILSVLSQGPYRSLLVVVASRISPTTRPDKVLELAPLEKRHLVQLTASMAGSLPTAVDRSILESTEGNPLLAVEMLRGMVESGCLEYRADGWVLRPGMSQQLSHRGAALLERRLETLSPAVTRSLEIAAVLGRSFSPALLQELAGESADALSEGRDRNLLWLRGDQAQFSHDRLRECLLARLPLERRRGLHTRAAALLAQQTPRPHREVAAHLGAAGRYREGFVDALAAAGEARSRSALPAAEEMYRLAVQGALTASEKCESLHGLGTVLDLRGRYDEARQALQQALIFAEPGRERSRIFARLGLVAQHDANNQEGVEHYIQALRELDLRIPSGLRDLPGAMGQLWFRVDQDDHAALMLAEATHCFFAAQRPFSGLYCQALSYRLIGHGTSISIAMASMVAASLGWPKAVPLLVARALARAQQEDGFTRGRVASRCAAALVIAGYVDEAFEAGVLAFRHLETSGDRWEMESYRVYSAWRLQARGRGAEAAALLATPFHDPLNEAARLWALSRLGKSSSQPIRVEGKGDNSLSHVLLLGAKGRELLAEGRSEAALEVLQAAVQVPQPVFGFELVWLRLALVEALRERAAGLPPGAERLDLLRRARSQARHVAGRASRYPLCGPQALRERALLAAERGQPYFASSLVSRALGEATRLGMPEEIEKAKALRLRLENPTVALLPPQAELTLAQNDRLAQVLATGRRLALLRERHELVEAILEAGLSLLRAEQVLWIEKDQAIRAMPAGRVAFSKALLRQARERGLARQVDRPESLSDSLLLSDIRSALCVRVDSESGEEGVLYFLHRGISSLFGVEEEDVASYLATLSGAGFTNQARRQAAATAHREREEQERRLAVLFRQAEAAMAVVSTDGELLETNRAWEETLGPVSPQQAVLPGDRDHLERRQTVRYARRQGGIGLAVPARQRLDDGAVLTTLIDVSLDRVPELLEYFEQERQWLAAELHDGPSQVLAHACMRRSTPRLRLALDEVLQLMTWLSSPLLEGVDFVPALARLSADVKGATELYGVTGTALFRVIQEILEGCSEDAVIELGDKWLEVHGSELALEPDARQRVELRCELAEVRLEWRHDGARATWARLGG